MPVSLFYKGIKMSLTCSKSSCNAAHNAIPDIKPNHASACGDCSSCDRCHNHPRPLTLEDELCCHVCGANLAELVKFFRPEKTNLEHYDAAIAAPQSVNPEVWGNPKFVHDFFIDSEGDLCWQVTTDDQEFLIRFGSQEEEAEGEVDVHSNEAKAARVFDLLSMIESARKFSSQDATSL